MKKLLNYSAYLVFTLSLIFFIFSVFAYFFFVVPLQSYELDASASISEGSIGVDVNDSALTFGIIAPGGTSLRKVFIANNYKFPVRIRAISDGEIEHLLDYPITTRVEPGQQATIPVTLVVPDNSSYGNYSGKVKFLVIRDK